MKLQFLWICLGIFIPTGWGKRDCGFMNNDIFLKKGDKREIKFWVHLNNTVAETWDPKQNSLTSPSVQDTNSPPELVILGRIPLHGPAAAHIPSTVAPSSREAEPENVAVIMAIDEGQTPVQETTPTLTSTESENETQAETTTVPLVVPSKWEISKFDEDISITEAEPEEFLESQLDPGAQSSPVQIALPATNSKDAPAGFLPEMTTESELAGTTVRENLQDEPITTQRTLNNAQDEATITPDYDSRSAETSIPTTVDESELVNNDLEPLMPTTTSTVDELEMEATMTVNADIGQRGGLQNEELNLTTESADAIASEDATPPYNLNELVSEDADPEASLFTTQNPVVELLLSRQNQLSESTESVQFNTEPSVEDNALFNGNAEITQAAEQERTTEEASTQEDENLSNNPTEILSRQNQLSESTESVQLNTEPSVEDHALFNDNAEITQAAEKEQNKEEVGTQEDENLSNNPTESIEHVTSFVDELLAKQNVVPESTDSGATTQTNVADNDVTEIFEDLNSRNAILPTTSETTLEAVEDPQVQELGHPTEPTTMEPEPLLPVTERFTEHAADDAAEGVTEPFLVDQAFDHLSSRHDAPEAMKMNTLAGDDSVNPTEQVLLNEPTEIPVSLLDNRSSFEETATMSEIPEPAPLSQTQGFDAPKPENVKHLDEQDLTKPLVTSSLPEVEIITEITDTELNGGTTDPVTSEPLNLAVTAPNSSNSTTNPPEEVDFSAKFPDVVQRNKSPLADSDDFSGLEPTLPTSTPQPPTATNANEPEPSSTSRPVLTEEESPSTLHTNQPPIATTPEPLRMVQEDSEVKSERIISRPKPSDLLSGIYRIVQSFSQQRLPFQGHLLRRNDNPITKSQEPSNNSRQIDPFVQLPAPNLALTNESRAIHQENHEVFDQFISMAQNKDTASPNADKVLGGHEEQEGIVTGHIHHRASHAPQTASTVSDTVNVDVTGVLPFESGPVLKKGSVVASEPAHDFGFRDGLTDGMRAKDNKFMKFIESQPMPLRMALLRGLPSRKARQVNSDYTECDWRIRTEPGLYLLVTFHNLSAPYTVDCHGAYIEVERENNGYEARWCGNRVTQGGTRSHVIFARTEVRVSVYDDGGREKEFPTGFAAEAEVIDLYDAGSYANFRRSEAYSNVRRMKG